MNRNNIYTVNPLYNGSTTQSTEDGSVQSGGTTIIYQQGGGTGLTDAQKQKLDGIQEGAEVNQNAYSKVRLNSSDTLIIEAKNKTDILNMSGVYPIAIAINGSGGLDFTVSSDQTNTNAVVTQSQLQAAIEKLQKDKYWKVDEDGKLYTELDVYSHKEISAYGAGTGGGSTGGAGALYECADVLRDGDKVKGAEVGSVLSYNGTHWYAIPQSAIVPDLSGYATKSYVSQEINDLIGGAPGTLDTLKEIAEALGNDPNFATTITNMINNIGLRVDDIEARVVSLEDMFEWDKSASASDSSLWRIKAKRDLFGVGEISAYGYSAGTVPTGAQYLYELKDVQLTDLATGQLLQYNGSKWVNIDKNAVGLNETELGRYLTNNNYAKKADITWANLLNKPTTWAWADITGKPTTLAGYGITDGVPNTRRVSAGSGLSGGGTLSSDVTISLGTIGTAGTYTKVTTDMYGRVVSGAALSEGDIPTLQISKISGLQTALDSKLNISDFSTWFTINKNASGQVISIQANFDFFGVGEISAYGLGETQPSVTTLAGLDDVTITSPANGQTLIYDSATSQWKNGTIIGGGNISLNGTVYKPVNGTITLPNLYEKVSGGTSSQFLKADGSIDGNLYALAYGGNQNKTQYSVYSRFTSYVQVIDRRSETPTPNSYEARNITAFFNAGNGMPDGNWWSGFHVRGWSDDYCTWELMGPSSTNNTAYNLRYRTGIGDTWGAWKMIMTDVEADDRYVLKTGDTITGRLEVRSTFLVVPSNIAGGYNEGIRVCNGSNNWSNIQFGARNSWNGMINGQWVVGKNPANYFQVCMAGTETPNTTRPSKGFSVDTNGYLHTGYISVEINTDNQGDYFYSSNDAFLRRSAWYAALSHLSNKQRTLDLTSLDQNKWYPCIIGTPAYGGTPLRITLFNGLRGNKPTWASHQQGFSLLLDYEVTGSGWGTIPIAAKLNWYASSFGGETAFGGRQQNGMASTEIIYLRGGGIYYYRTTNSQELTVQPNGYTWNNGSYNYSAPVKTSQDNSPIEKTFDQVYWAPNNLRNTRTIWGQPFNGAQNVSGALSGATTITATGDITTSANIRGRSINAGGDLTVAGYTYCNGRLYVDRGRYSITSAPTISLAIGDTDTGFHWESDGIISIYCNNSAVGGWRRGQFRYGHGYLKEATGNDYHTLGIMVNGNGTANTIKPGIGFHQPGVYANSLRSDGPGNFRFCVQGGTVGCQVQAGSFYANGGLIYSNANGCQAAFGSQNASYVHITNNANRAYYMDHTLHISGDVAPYTNEANALGNSSKWWGGIYGKEVYVSSWVRFTGASGVYWTSYDGGWTMNDATYIRSYGGKSLWIEGSIIANGEVTAYSDIRLKSNIKPLGYKGRLAPKQFIKDNKPCIGFIAQEVQTLYPELVKVNTSTIENYLSLNYGAITAVLSAQVNKVEDEVEVLKNRIRQLENEVALLKQKP